MGNAFLGEKELFSSSAILLGAVFSSSVLFTQLRLEVCKEGWVPKVIKKNLTIEHYRFCCVIIRSRKSKSQQKKMRFLKQRKKKSMHGTLAPSLMKIINFLYLHL